MKKRFVLLAALILSLSACGDLVEMPETTPSNPQTDTPVVDSKPILGGKVKFTASIGDCYAVDKSVIASLWAGNEKITIFDGTDSKIVSVTKAGEISEFEVDIAEGTKEVYAVSPFVNNVSVKDGKMNVEFTPVQTIGSSPNFLLCKSTGTHLFFTPMHSEVFFTVDADGVKSAIFEATAPVSGHCEVRFENEIQIQNATQKTVELKGDFVKGQKYSFTCLPANIESYTIKLSNGKDIIATLQGENLNLRPACRVDLGNIIEDVPTYKMSHVWVFGGTGLEYGGGKVYDLFTIPEFFNEDDGRGIVAWKDNYLEMHHDGTFRNWAGEDGRNWWMVYSGRHNPVNGKDIDISNFFDLIPRSEATWVKTDTGYSFTKPDGKVVEAEVLSPGTHTLYAAKNVTVTTTSPIALKFKISGGHDDWNNMYNEFNAITCRPKAFIVELEPMAIDFHAPESSRKTDSDFQYVAPPEPSDKFDFANWPGKWNVRGGNASPFGIWVLGGTGDDPAFVCPIDKSWLWDDTIWKESDNELIIDVTSSNAKEIKGTTNYWAGNDGAFWNYKWKATGEDLSRLYGLLPHGKYEFVLNLEKFEIVLGNSVVAKFLEPGTHKFVHGKTIDVPDGCFGLSFSLGTDAMETPGPNRWKDVDRFIEGIRNYVMIFEK